MSTLNAIMIIILVLIGCIYVFASLYKMQKEDERLMKDLKKYDKNYKPELDPINW